MCLCVCVGGVGGGGQLERKTDKKETEAGQRTATSHTHDPVRDTLSCSAASKQTVH